MSCLDDETVHDLIEGQLDRESLGHVDAHLDGCASCRTLLLEVARAARPSDAPDAGAGNPLPRRGALVNRFVVTGEVGVGAMGVVYAAYDPELDRKVALKLLRPGVAEEPELARARLVREAQAMAKLAHPNVVTVFDVGTWGDAVFVAMELVPGVTLREWIGECPRSWREVVDVFVQAGRGLAAAHAAGLIHRDFKPDNVIVSPDGRARVTDFGLARAVGPEPAPARPPDGDGEDGAATLTRTGWVLGTPAYMAPEQLRGRHADARSDQYSFAVALYEALDGKRPTEGRTIADVAAKAEAGDMPPPGRGTPRWLGSAVLRALRPDPDARFPTMDALLDALGHEATLRRRRLLGATGIAAAAMAASAVAIGFAAGSEPSPAVCSGADAALAEAWSGRDARAVRAAFVRTGHGYAAEAGEAVVSAIDAWGRDWTAMHGSACRATRVTGEQSEAVLDLRMACLARQLGELDALKTALARADATTVAGAHDAVAALPPVAACADVAALQAVVPPPRGAAAARIERLRRRLAEARAAVATGRYARAGELAGPLLREAADIGYLPVVAEARLLAAAAARAGGALAEADAHAHEALWAAEEGRDDHAVARSWIELVEIAGAGGRLDDAARTARHAQAAVARLGSPPALEAALRGALGEVYESLGRHDDAERELRRALSLRRREHAPGPVIARIETSLGNVERARGRNAEALAHHRRALELDRAALGDDHPSVGRHLHNIARLLLVTGRREEALDHYLRALAIKEAAYGADHPDVARTRNSLGLVYTELGRMDDARRAHEEAARIFEAAAHPDAALALTNLGLLDARAGDHAAALARFDRALELARRPGAGEGDGERIARVLVARGASRHALGRHDDARADYSAALEHAATSRDEALLLEARAGMELAARPTRGPSRPPASGTYLPGRPWDTPAPPDAEPRRDEPEPSYLPGRPWDNPQ